MNKQQIEQLASQCVMCALCSEACPSYQLHQDENHSPRGRIALIRALANEQLKVDSHNAEHIDTCLQCFNCSSRCPSQVNYPQLIYYGNQLLHKHKRHKKLLAGLILEKTIYNNFMKFCIKFMINSLTSLKMMNFFKKLIPSKLACLLPDESLQQKKATRLLSSKGIVLHSGCVELSNPQILQDALDLLNILGIPIREITSQCCGAMAKRNGDESEIEKAQKLFHQMSDKIISLNSSCAAHLQQEVSSEAQDIVDFIAENNISLCAFSPLNKKVFLHHSCSVKHRIKNSKTTEQLLNLIPEIQLLKLEKMSCCGAGGNFMLNYPQQSAQLAELLTDFVMKQKIQMMVSSDISCALHIKSQLAMRGYKLEVCHPISLLYRQLKTED